MGYRAAAFSPVPIHATLGTYTTGYNRNVSGITVNGREQSQQDRDSPFNTARRYFISLKF